MEIGIHTSSPSEAAGVLEALAEALREGAPIGGEMIVNGAHVYVSLGEIPKSAGGSISALDKPQNRGDNCTGVGNAGSFFGSEKPSRGTLIKRTTEERAREATPGKAGEDETPKRPKKSAAARDSKNLSAAQAIYAAFPRKVGRKAAEKAILKALREVDAETLLGATQRFARLVAGKDAQYIPHPATWFNQGRWEDEDLADDSPTAQPTAPGITGPRVDASPMEANLLDVVDVEW